MRFENTCLLVHGSLVVVVRSAACTALDRRQQMRARRSQPRKLTGSQAVEQPSPKAQRQRVIIVDPSGGFLGGSNREHAVGQKGTMGGGHWPECPLHRMVCCLSSALSASIPTAKRLLRA